jgi:hypothetical protein
VKFKVVWVVVPCIHVEVDKFNSEVLKQLKNL